MTKALRYELFPERRSISTANNLNITMRVGCERTLELVMQYAMPQLGREPPSCTLAIGENMFYHHVGNESTPLLHKSLPLPIPLVAAHCPV
jgi:hypothetical protein